MTEKNTQLPSTETLSSSEITQTEKRYFKYLSKLIFVSVLLTLLCHSGDTFAQKADSKVDNSRLAAALLTLHERKEYTTDEAWAWEENRGSGSVVEIDGKLWLLTIEHNVRPPGNLRIPSIGEVKPQQVNQWLGLPFLVADSTGDINEQRSPELSFQDTNHPVDFEDDQDSSILIKIPDKISDLIISEGIKPLTNVESITREDLDPNHHYYLISAFTVDVPPSPRHPKVWITTLKPSTEERYVERFLEEHPYFKDAPALATTDFIPDYMLPFEISSTAQSIENFIDPSVNPDLDQLRNVGLCESMSGSVVVRTTQTLEEINSINDLTVIGTFSGPSALGNLIPIYDPDGNQLSCAAIGDFARVVPIQLSS